MRASDVLMLTCGFNGYAFKYGACVASHRRYAKRFNYPYLLCDCPTTLSGADSKWLKLPMMLRCFEDGWPWLFFIDVDCEIQSRCPDVLSIVAANKDIYFAHGFSGRINSGVILARNTPRVVEAFQRIIANRDKPLPPEDGVADGENGQVIHYFKHLDWVQIVDAKWNNNVKPSESDYITHYTGPMSEMSGNWRGKGFATRSYARLRNLLRGNRAVAEKTRELDSTARLKFLAEHVYNRNRQRLLQR